MSRTILFLAFYGVVLPVCSDVLVEDLGVHQGIEWILIGIGLVVLVSLLLMPAQDNLRPSRKTGAHHHDS